MIFTRDTSTSYFICDAYVCFERKSTNEQSFLDRPQRLIRRCGTKTTGSMGLYMLCDRAYHRSLQRVPQSHSQQPACNEIIRPKRRILSFTTASDALEGKLALPDPTAHLPPLGPVALPSVPAYLHQRAPVRLVCLLSPHEFARAAVLC